MKTKEEILEQYESFHYTENGCDETHYYKDNVLLAMEEYANQQLQLGGVVSSSDTKKYWKCSLCKDTFEEKQAHECLNGFRANGMFWDEVE